MTTILEQVPPARTAPPQLGFVGVGWIGRNRMQAISSAGAGTVALIIDSEPGVARNACDEFTAARADSRFEALFDADLDGVVIATPSALHAEQCIAALERGLPVFCQKPLGRDAGETRAVIAAARRANRLLGVDLSYRFTLAALAIRDLVAQRTLGRIFAVDLAFHNAYGPDKPWFYDRTLSGGGCVIDLGTHLVDLALWLLGNPRVEHVESSLYAEGAPVRDRASTVEDYATATLLLEGAVTVRLACSWRLHAGQDAVIEASVYGTDGGAAMRNVNGSFYDFTAEYYNSTRRQLLVSPPDAWGGRAAVAWAQQLAHDNRYDSSIEDLERVAEALDWMYRA